MSRHLFVCGCGRSGTSVMTELLSRHPDIAIGMERFAWIATRRPDEFTPALFEPQRFLDVQAGDTFYDDLSFFAHYARIEEKYAGAAWVGDKIPRLYERYAMLAATFPDARVVFMSRDLTDVATSWKVRASDPDDTLFPSSMGVKEAIRQWNESHRDTLAALDQMDIFVLRFETLFDVGDITPLFDYLGLEINEDTHKWWAWTRDRYLEKRARDRTADHRIRLSWLERRRVRKDGDSEARAELIRAAQARGTLL